MKLRDPDHEITVYERNEADATHGWGVAFAPAILSELHQNDEVSAQAIERSALRWSRQYVTIRGERVAYDSGMEMYNLNRPRLVEILARRAQDLGVAIKYGREVNSAGEFPEANLVVATDGAGSRVRQASANFGSTVRLYHDKYAWLGTDKPFDAFAYHFTLTGSGWIWAASYGVESELSTFVVHCSSQTWTGLGFEHMPPNNCLAALEGLFKEQLEGHHLIGRVSDEMGIRWLSSRNVANRRWHDGKVVLLGDSAHAPNFTAGLGTTLALEGAIALANNVHQSDDLEISLQQYERECRDSMRKSWDQVARSGQWFSSIARYIDFKPRQFTTLIHARRSALLPLVHPECTTPRQLHRRITCVIKAMGH